MTKNSLAIAGTNRLADEFLALAREHGFEPIRCDSQSTIPATVNSIIDTETGTAEKKRALLGNFDAALPNSAVIITSCLRLTASEIASSLKRPERLVGFATFYPLNDRKLIELTAGLRTSESALAQAEELFKSLGKETVRVKDSPGLTFPRILSLIINEAARSLEEGVASAEEIDIAMRLGVNYPQGPLKWADQIGLDEVLAVLDGLHGATGDDRYRAAPLIRKLVASGFLGETSGRGFYSYSEGQVKP
ncbi:MAG TPA: 3-hydroxyacyl-CoA dehydrogenase family protein [Candidatus Binatia bacterium]